MSPVGEQKCEVTVFSMGLKRIFIFCYVSDRLLLYKRMLLIRGPPARYFIVTVDIPFATFPTLLVYLLVLHIQFRKDY